MEYVFILVVSIFMVIVGILSMWALSMLLAPLYGDMIIRYKRVQEQRKRWENKEEK